MHNRYNWYIVEWACRQSAGHLGVWLSDVPWAMGHGVTVVLFSLTISDPRGATLVYVLFIFLRTPFQTTAAFTSLPSFRKKNKKIFVKYAPNHRGCRMYIEGSVF